MTEISKAKVNPGPEKGVDRRLYAGTGPMHNSDTQGCPCWPKPEQSSPLVMVVGEAQFRSSCSHSRWLVRAEASRS